MSKVIFILGGARSGKSSYAAAIARKLERGYGKRTVFIATAMALDGEMERRIAAHKRSRPKSWGLIEEPEDLSGVVLKLKSIHGAAIIDCLGLWISNLLMSGMSDSAIEKRIKALLRDIRLSRACLIVIVSNEVGEGIVPADELSRRFRDLIGLTNQRVAGSADDVFLMKAGIPIKIK